MNKIIKTIKLVLLLLTLSSLIVFFFPKETYKEFGEYSWFLLIIVMFVRPLRDIFPKCKIFWFVSKFRRELWILVWVFGLAHGIGSFLDQKLLFWDGRSYIEMFLDPYVWNYTGYMFWWMLAAIVSIPLLITSNGVATSLLGKNWKHLQRLAYFMFFFVGIHIYFIKRESWVFVLLSAWLVLWIIAWIKNKKSKKVSWNGPKWLCVPCGYIYDETLWDPDSWIAPGTKFEDIPNDWRCPVCWVWKSDFVLIEWDIVTHESEIVSLKYLTHDVIELKVDLKQELAFTSGQFLTFVFQDEAGEFQRSYSIAEKQWNIYMFLIRLKPDGRAWILYRTKKQWDTLGYTNIAGHFTLKNTQNPKVFIATGTWLSPIYNMLLHTADDIPKQVFFGGAFLKDMFYIEELKKFKNVQLHLYLSKEDVEWYHYGRMNFESLSFEANTEFYICGSPGLVVQATEVLHKNGYTQVYSEEFN